MTIELSLFDHAVKYSGINQFDCGHQIINTFAHGSLKQQVKKGLSVAYVLTDSNQADKFVGFYTIANHAIPVSGLAALALGSLPKVVPCTRVIMLGVDKGYTGQGFGKQLMKHALQTAKTAAQSVGSFGVYLDADEGASSFYLALGFVFLQGDLKPSDSPMFLPMASIP
ncbi:GNAT family N-acetyltransferase [Burkholderia glumae]